MPGVTFSTGRISAGRSDGSPATEAGTGTAGAVFGPESPLAGMATIAAANRAAAAGDAKRDLTTRRTCILVGSIPLTAVHRVRFRRAFGAPRAPAGTETAEPFGL